MRAVTETRPTTRRGKVGETAAKDNRSMGLHLTDRMKAQGVPGIYWLVNKICWKCKSKMATDGTGTYWCAGKCVPANFGKGG